MFGGHLVLNGFKNTLMTDGCPFGCLSAGGKSLHKKTRWTAQSLWRHATDIVFHLGLLRALRHPLRHKDNICHVRSRCTGSFTRSGHDELGIAIEYNDVGQRTRVPFVKSYYAFMATMSFKVLDWWLCSFGGRQFDWSL